LINSSIKIDLSGFCDVTGYLIPKGWKVMTWFRSVHLDPEIYPNPKDFNPERWNVSWNDLVETFELKKFYS